MLGRSPPSALDASLALYEMQTKESDIQSEYTQVRRAYTEYDPQAWMRLMSSINDEFGRSGKRWQWIMNNELSQGNAWVVDFYFEDPHDAILFQLKY